MYDLLIKNGIIIDGKKSTPFIADIGVKGERIASIGRIDRDKGKRIIEAEGLIVCPGFVDIHGHSDFTLLVDPAAESKVRQGVTTEVGGNCGFSAAPRFGEGLRRGATICQRYNLKANWNTLREYLSRLERKGLGVNFVPLVGHGNLRASFLGYEKREVRESELRGMKEILRNSMFEGSFGMSSGLMYAPGCFSSMDELIELCKVVAEFDGVYSTHLRDEGMYLFEAIDEAIKVGSITSVKVQISHLKISDMSSWGKLDEVFKKIELALKDGVKISCDRYPYTASSTNLESVLPDFAFAGGREAEIKRLRNKYSRKRIKQALMHTYSKNFWKRVMISSLREERNKWMEGRKISEIAKIKGKHPCEFVLDLLAEEEAQVTAIFFTMDERNLRRILVKPYTMIGSDSASRPTYGVLATERVHPRCFGTFPRVLRKYVLEERILGIEEAIYKMTWQPIRLLGIEDRGVVEEGKYADLTIFDENTLHDRATYQFPYRYPAGVKYVILNGTLVIDDGVHTGVFAGKVLRKEMY